MRQKQSTMGGNNEPVTDPASAASPASPQAEQEQKPIDLGLLQNRVTASDLHDSIFSFLNTKRLAPISRLNQLFHSTTGRQMTLRRLMHHVARGEYDKDIPQIKAILTAHPELLLQKSRTIDLSGRSFIGLSPWQLAWCTGDDDMVTKMKAYTQPSKLDQQLMADQLHELFPGGYEAHLAQQADEKSVFNFNAIVAAIDGADDAQLQSAIDLKGAVLPATDASSIMTMTSNGTANELTKALNIFRQAFTTQSLQEKIFNPQHLLRALEIYTHQYNDYSNLKKKQVFWTQVIGFIQRFMPACYAQAFAQGLYWLAKIPGIHRDDFHPEVLLRSLDFRSPKGKIFSGAAGFWGSGALGFKFAVHADGDQCDYVVGRWLTRGCSGFKKLCQTKNRILCGLMPEPVQQMQPAP